MPLPGPTAAPTRLAELQRLAAANSPALRQAASDVETARGLLQQAGTYPNPTMASRPDPTPTTPATGTLGFFIDQVIKTGGKLKLAAAAAQMNLKTRSWPLKRARIDLATTVRTAYYSLVVAKETVRVNKALARFTDEIFRLQSDLLGGRVRRQPRASGPAVAGLHRSAGLQASYRQLRVCLEATRR